MNRVGWVGLGCVGVGVGVGGEGEEFLVACANGVVSGPVVDVGGEVGVAKGVDVVAGSYEEDSMEDYFEVGCVEEVPVRCKGV